MRYKDTNKFINKAYPDEALFVLMARDKTAPQIILDWVKANLFNQPSKKLQEAIAVAFEMMETQEAISARIENEYKKRMPPFMKPERKVLLDNFLKPYEGTGMPGHDFKIISREDYDLIINLFKQNPILLEYINDFK